MEATKRILLVEPSYRNKYPPLGLMKVATYHKLQGDEVKFVKGCQGEERGERWDHIYITTLFSFHWRITVETIRYYARRESPIHVGGILASLMPEELEKATGITPHIGPLTEPVALPNQLGLDERVLAQLAKNASERGIDALPPDYGIFDDTDVPYGRLLDDFYILRTSRGCRRECGFCAVPILEPTFVDHIPIMPSVRYIADRWGEKAGLLLLDDNVLQSSQFDNIVDEIRDAGFGRGSMLHRKRRSVDFNQGLDARLMTPSRLSKLATIEVRPLRLAFDDIALSAQFGKLVSIAHDHGFKEISTYVLFNYNDRPKDLYERLRFACELNRQLGTRIYSFPMKYIPCGAKDRQHIGAQWNRRQIRGVQCILNASHGIAPRDARFFYEAFGNDAGEFLRIIQMPEDYIINRRVDANKEKVRAWSRCLDGMTSEERDEAMDAVSFGKGSIRHEGTTERVKEFLRHYEGEQGYK